MRLIAMFEEIKALPGAKHEPAIRDGNADGNHCERRFDVGGHVVGPLQGVDNPPHGRIARRRDETGEKLREIAPDVGIGIFLDEQGTGRVPDKDSQQAFRYPGLIYEAFCFRRKLVKALPVGRDDYFLLRHVFLSNSREQNRRCERCTMSNSIRWR